MHSRTAEEKQRGVESLMEFWGGMNNFFNANTAVGLTILSLLVHKLGERTNQWHNQTTKWKRKIYNVCWASARVGQVIQACVFTTQRWVKKGFKLSYAGLF